MSATATTEPAAATARAAAGPTRHDIRRGALCMLGATLSFSLMFALAKPLGRTIPFPEIMFVRCVLALPIMTLVVLRVGGARMLGTKRLRGHVVRAVTSLVAMCLAFYAVTVLPLAELTALTYSAPLFVTILSIPMLGEKVGRHRWSAVLAGFLGILVIASTGRAGFQLSGAGALLLFGAAAAVGNGFASALSTLQVRQLSATEHSATIVMWQSLLVALFTALSLPAVWVTPGWGELGLLLLLGLFGGIGQLLWTEAYASAQASSLGVYTYTGILWAIGLGWLLYDEAPRAGTLGGAALIIAAGLYILHREMRKPR